MSSTPMPAPFIRTSAAPHFLGFSWRRGWHIPFVYLELSFVRFWSLMRNEFRPRAQDYFFSWAGQFVSRVIELDLARSAVRTAKCWPSGLTSYIEFVAATSGYRTKIGSVVKTAITSEMNRLDVRFDPIAAEGLRRRDAEARSRTDYRNGLVAARIGGSAEIDFKRVHRKQASATPKLGCRVTVVSPKLQGRPIRVRQGAGSTFGIQVCRKRRFVHGGFAPKGSGRPVAPLPNGADSVIGYLETTRRRCDLLWCTFTVFAHGQIDSHVD